VNSTGHPIVERLVHRFPGVDFKPTPLSQRKQKENEQLCVRIEPGLLLDAMRFLRDDEASRFEQLADLTCIDYLNYPDAQDRFAVIYTLTSVSRSDRFWVKCYVNDPSPEVPSVTGIWKGADWLEREVWDLFGIRFTGHPDLRRIMTWEGFEAHPLRKDYPLHGRGERENFEVVGRDGA